MANQAIKLSLVLNLMEQGYTRLEKDAYEPTKSLEKFFDLSAIEKEALFNHAKVKGVRVKTPVPVVVIIDDLDMIIEDDVTETPVVESAPVVVEEEPGVASIEAALDAVEVDEEAVFA